MIDFFKNNIIAILACVFALITAGINLINYINRRKRPCKIKYYPRGEFIVVNKSGLDKFEIKYKDNPVSKNIIFISGDLVSRGKDINTTSNSINIYAPDNCNWLEMNIENQDNCGAKVELLNDKQALLSFNKFRSNKCISIYAILETEKVISPLELRDIHNFIKFEHTIDNTDDVKIVAEKSYELRSFINTLTPTITTSILGNVITVRMNDK